MNDTSIQPRMDASDAAVIEQVIINGDLEKLSPQMRVTYYNRVCESVGLNPFTQPFAYIRLNSKLTLYATKTATDQLRKIHGVSVRVVGQERIDDVLVVTVEATDKSGRIETEVGAVTIGNLKGDALANAMMKALTKAKRRVTLSICGLGMLDESETETIRGAQPAPQYSREIAASHAEIVDVVDTETGEIVDAPRSPSDEQQATERQIKMIFGVGRDNGWSVEELRAEMVERFGVEHSNELTVRQASEFIDMLKDSVEDAQPQLV